MRRLTAVFTIFFLLVMLLSGCSDNSDEVPPETPSGEPAVTLFDFLADERSTVFAANYQTDKPVSVSYGLYTDGEGFLSHSVSGETINAVFNALSQIEIGSEAVVLADDYNRRFVFTMSDGREYVFDFNVLSIDCGGTQYTVDNDTDLWNIPFPIYGETSVFSLYPDDLQSFADNFQTDIPVSVAFEYNGAEPFVSHDAAKIKAVFDSLSQMQVTSFVDPGMYHKTSSDETKYSYTFTMSDGRRYTLAFCGDHLEFNSPFGYYCGVTPADSPEAFAFEGYESLSPAIDENGRKTVDESLKVAGAGPDTAVLLIRTDYILSGGNEVAVYDVTIAKSDDGYRVIYNYGGYKRYEYAENFTASAPTGLPVPGTAPEYAAYTGAEDFTRHLRTLSGQLANAAGKGDYRSELKGLSYEEYAFLYEAALNDRNEIESMKYLWLS